MREIFLGNTHFDLSESEKRAYLSPLSPPLVFWVVTGTRLNAVVVMRKSPWIHVLCKYAD